MSEYRWALDVVAAVVGAIEAALREWTCLTPSSPISRLAGGMISALLRLRLRLRLRQSASPWNIFTGIEIWIRLGLWVYGFFFGLLSSSKMVWASQCVFYKMSDVSRST